MPRPTVRRGTDPDLVARLFEDNQNLVRAWVYRHWGMEAPYWVRDAALVGYENACMAYDPSRGRLSTLAWTAMWRQVAMARRARENDLVGHAATLDRPMGDGVGTAVDIRPDPAAEAGLDDALTAMTTRGYRTLDLVLAGETKREIGGHMGGVSREYACRVFRREVRQWARDCGVAVDA